MFAVNLVVPPLRTDCEAESGAYISSRNDYGVRDALIELVSGQGHPVLACADAWQKPVRERLFRRGAVTVVCFASIWACPGIGRVDVIRCLK